MNRTTRLLGALAASTLLAACTSAEAVDDEATTPASDTITVTGVDYGFDGLDGTVDAGSTLAFRNGSDAEFHEMVLFRIADDEDRTVAELFSLPEEEGMAALTFVGVAAGGPGETGALLEGDLTVTEPGRYALACFVPVGADPDVVAEAFAGASEGPPELPEGKPHVAAGMNAEFEVE